MLKGIDVNQRIEFISKEDISEPKTIFILRPLTGFEMMELQSLSTAEDLFKLVRKSIVEITNGESDLDKMILNLPVATVSELVVFILKLNNLTEADKKK